MYARVFLFFFCIYLKNHAFEIARSMKTAILSLLPYYNQPYCHKGSKNISIKMLKDVGMTVPKSRETSAVYMQQDRG